MFINEHGVTELSCSFLLFLLPTDSFPLTERPLVGKTFPFFTKPDQRMGFTTAISLSWSPWRHKKLLHVRIFCAFVLGTLCLVLVGCLLESCISSFHPYVRRPCCFNVWPKLILALVHQAEPTLIGRPRLVRQVGGVGVDRGVWSKIPTLQVHFEAQYYLASAGLICMLFYESSAHRHGKYTSGSIVYTRT